MGPRVGPWDLGSGDEVTWVLEDPIVVMLTVLCWLVPVGGPEGPLKRW